MSSRPGCPIAQIKLNGTKGSPGFYPQRATVPCSGTLGFWGADSTRFADPECLAFNFTIYTAIVRLQ